MEHTPVLAAMMAALENGAVKGACDCSECAHEALDAIPDGWAKVDGKWIEVEFIGNYRGRSTWTARLDA